MMVSRNHPFELFRLVFGEGAGNFLKRWGEVGLSHRTVGGTILA